jgi:hypothetical protein
MEKWISLQTLLYHNQEEESRAKEPRTLVVSVSCTLLDRLL